MRQHGDDRGIQPRVPADLLARLGSRSPADRHADEPIGCAFADYGVSVQAVLPVW
jgi:hypothetical protein